MGMVEFEGAVDGLRIDSRLVKEGSEPPVAYVAVAGTQVGARRSATRWSSCRSRRSRRGWPTRRRGAPAASSAVLREEIEELRGRLRRAAEDRAALDAEVPSCGARSPRRTSRS